MTDRRTILWQGKDYKGGVGDSWCLLVGVWHFHMPTPLTPFLLERERGRMTCNLTTCWLKGLIMGLVTGVELRESWIQHGRGLSYCLLPHYDLPRRQTRPAASRRTDYTSQHPPGLPTGHFLPDWSHYLNCWACLQAVEEAEVEGVRWWMIEPGFQAPGSALLCPGYRHDHQKGFDEVQDWALAGNSRTKLATCYRLLWDQ